MSHTDIQIPPVEQSMGSVSSRQQLQDFDQSGVSKELGEHLDTADLEEIAVLYDQIRELRKRIPNNDDFDLGK